MTTDDDRQLPEQDSQAEPTRGRADAADDQAESFPFSFDTLDEIASPPADPETAHDIPLVVFPPDAEPGLADLGLMDDDEDLVAQEALAAADSLDDSADFGATTRDSAADDVSFDAGVTNEESPFASSVPVDSWANAAESAEDDHASIPLAAAVAVAAATTAVEPMPARKKRGGLGRMIGVVVGGLMALPIAYSLLMFGLHQDPLKIARQLPSQWAFLLPQKLQPGASPPSNRPPAPAPDLQTVAVSEDAVVSSDGMPPPTSLPADPPDATIAGEPSPVEPVTPVEAVAAPVEAVASPVETVAAPVESAAAPEQAVAVPDAHELADPASPAEPLLEAVPQPASEPDTIAALDTVTPTAPVVVDLSPTPVPQSDTLAGIDALVADVASVAPPVPEAIPTGPAATAMPPIDLSAVEQAAEKATHAFDALATISDRADPARDRLLVEWYKRLAQLDEELVTLETKAADSGRPFLGTPADAADLLDRISISEPSVADLDRLGRMWLTTEKRRADGISLVATLTSSRPVGPFWSTQVVVAGGNSDGSDRTVSIISRVAPPADPGNRVVVSGVLLDGNAVWAADMRPIAPLPEDDDDVLTPEADAQSP